MKNDLLKGELKNRGIVLILNVASFVFLLLGIIGTSQITRFSTYNELIVPFLIIALSIFFYSLSTIISLLQSKVK